MALTTDLGLLISAVAATTTQNSGDLFNLNSKGAIIFLGISNIGSASLTLKVQGKDTVSGQYFDILTSAAVAANGFTVYRVYPGLTPASNVTVSDIIPNCFRVSVLAGNANAATYTVGGSLIS